MVKTDLKRLLEEYPVLRDIQQEKEVVWIDPDKTSYEESMKGQELSLGDVDDAEERLLRFAPLIMRCFPETRDRDGLIESALLPIPRMQERLEQRYGSRLSGRLFLKQDSHLAIAGSVKARGGIYEVLKHTEDLALEHGILDVGGVMRTMLSGEFTVRDAALYHYMRDLLETEDIFLEPSACAAFQGPIQMGRDEIAKRYLEENGLADRMAQATHIAWATGGSLVPAEIREEYKNTYL